jgi:predicted ATPase/transcriptional regulator with XRE-family HTH domain
MTIDHEITFGDWLRHRRKAGDLTQDELARQVGCSTIALRKMEAEERRPSKQTAERMAEILGISPEERPAFIRFARGEIFAVPDTKFSMPTETAPWRTMPPRLPRGDVPVPITPLIGRERDLAALRRVLLAAETRLLTIIGPPGVGKTRLAMQIASEPGEEFPDGVFFIALAPLRDPSLVAGTIAQVLGIQETVGCTIVEVLQANLRDRQMMLVLDNFEQIVDAASFVLELLMACPRMKVLITSRVALRVPGEKQFLLAPLTVPDPASLPDLGTLSRFASVALFLDRAKAVQPAFHLTQENASSVVAICAHTNGLPLAIELIATLTPLLPSQSLLERLDNSGLMMHLDSRRGVPARQRTLHDTIQWSFELLKPHEQTLCARLAVFTGGFTLEAVETVCGNTGGSLPLNQIPAYSVLNSLLSQSLLKRESDADGETRYTMLEMIHHFMLEKLEERGEVGEMRRRHALYYLELIEKAAPNFFGAEQIWWLNRTEREQDNLRAAIQWTLEQSELEMAMRLCISMPWKIRLHLGEARRWLEQLLTAARGGRLPPSLLASILNEVGDVAYLQCDYAGSRSAHEEALTLARETDNKRAIAFALYGLGNLAINQGTYDWAAVLSDECLPLAWEVGDKWLAAMTLTLLGEMARLQGDYETALTRYAEGLAVLRQLGDKFFIAILLDNQGQVLWHQGNSDKAAEIFAECLTLAKQFDNARQMALSLERLAKVAVARKQPEKAVRLLGAAGNMRQSAGVPMEAFDLPEYERIVADARHQLGEVAFDPVWAEGRAMSSEQVVEYALSNIA